MNILKSVSVLAIAQSMAYAPAIGADDADNESMEFEEIVVVGSSIKSNANYDTNSKPVQLITTDQFQAGSGQQVAQFLHSMPIVSGFNNTTYTSEYTGGESSVNLRGLGEKYTLVLVNGRRAGSRYNPDLESIPSIAIENIEVLKAGASAIYGTDAVAGVMNVRLKNNFSGLEMEASYGQTTKGDSETLQIGALFGLSEDRMSFTGSIMYQDNKGFDKEDRDRTSTRDFRRFGGYDFRSAVNGIPHLITLGDGSQVSIDTSRFGPGHYSGDLSDYVAYNGELQNASLNETSTNPAFERVSGHWAFEYRADEDHLNFFAEGFIDYRNMPAFTWNNVPVTLSVPADQYYNPFGEDVTVNYEIAEQGIYTRQYKTLNWQAAFGARGEIVDGYNYEVVYTNHKRRNNRTFPIPWIDRTRLNAALMRDDALAFNPFGYLANSEEQLDLVRGPGGREIVTDKIETIDVKIDGELFDWYAGTSYFAIGYQHRDMFFAYEPDHTRQTTDEFGCGIDATTGLANCGETPFDESRKIDAIFAELLLPVYKASDDDAVIQSAEVSGAVRKEKYSDFGSVTIWQASGKVDMLDDSLTLRASWSQSFKAPSITDLFRPVTTRTDTTEEAFLRDPVRGGVFPVTRITGGNVNLRPEIGTSINFGAIFKPESVPGLSLTVDYWILELDDIIVTPDMQAVLNGTSLVGSITRDPVTQHPTIDGRTDNGGKLELNGIDFNVAYNLSTDSWGMFDFTWTNTYLNKYEEFGADGVTSVRRDGFDLRPKFRSVFTTSWALGNFDANASLRYMDGWEDAAEPDTPISSYKTVDMQVGYTFDEEGFMAGTRMYVGVENLFDPFLPFVKSSRDGWARALHDYRGRYVYAGVRKAF